MNEQVTPPTNLPHPDPAPTTTSRSRSWLVALALLVITLTIAGWWWFGPKRSEPDSRNENDEDSLVVINPGYVGPQACAECHAARVEEFKATRHFRACWSPEAGPMPPGFTRETGTFSSRNAGIHFAMQQSGRDFTQTLFRETPTGQTATPQRIDLIYGSGGKADEVFFTWKDDRLYELPIAWIHPMKRWAEATYDPHQPGDFTRTTTVRCVECHNTWIEHVPGTENQYRREQAHLGVTCEKCHGPGRDHVSYHRAHPEARSAQAIVHPGELSRERLMDVCGQCHSNTIYPRTPAFTYRPGEPLAASFRTLEAKGLENDHVADQVKYLKQSKCYQKSDTLTCITCHDPHRPENPASVAGACLECHRPVDCREQPRLPLGVRQDCVGCHMPRYNRVAIKFHTREDQYFFPMRPHEHRIGIYPEARQEVLLNWYRSQTDPLSRKHVEQLETALAEHWLAEADERSLEYQLLATIGALREAVRFDTTGKAKAKLTEAISRQAKLDADFGRVNRFLAEERQDDARSLLEAILRVKPNFAKVHGKLGTLYHIAGQTEKGNEHLLAVARLDPDDAYGYNMLGWIAYLNGRGQDAIDAFRRAEEIYPNTAEISYRWGLALVSLERWTEAEARFRLALRSNPNHPASCQGLSQALRQRRQFEEAVRFAKKAVRLTQSRNAEMLLSLAEAYADAGRQAEAKATADEALNVAEGGAPETSSRIQRRVRQLLDGVGQQR